MYTLDDAQQHLQAAARELAQTILAPRAAAVDAQEAYPWDNVCALTDGGFMGMTLPRAWGGQGRNLFDTVLVVEELAKACAVTARIVVEANMGAVGALFRYGSDAQKRRVAPLVLAGDKPAICITEPNAGSDATAMTTTAVRRGDRYIINGTKHWITGGGVSKTHLIFARVVENGEYQGIGGFIAVAGEDPGIVVKRREPTMGLRGMPETELAFEDLEVPAAMALVPPQGLKRGFATLMNAYNGQRVGAATVALGIATGAFDHAVAYVKDRRQFGRPIAEFQGLQWMLADMDIQLHAARQLVWAAAMGAQHTPAGFPDPKAAARAKIYAAETAVKVTNDALQLHGAAGYSRDLPLERMVRDARMFTIGGGTAQVLRNLMAGAILERKLPQTRDGYRAMEPSPNAVGDTSLA